MRTDLAMGRDDRRTYTYDRKLFREEGKRTDQVDQLTGLVIHNAYTTAEVDRLLKNAGVVAEKYTPKKSTEVHFYDAHRGIIHAVNSRGVIRLVRDKDLAWSLEDLLERTLSLSIDHHGGDEALAYRRFREEFGFGLIDNVMADLKAYDQLSQVRKQKKIVVMMGPHESLAVPETELVTPAIVRPLDDFLKYRIFRVGENVVIDFDYIFADQAKNVLSQLCSSLSANVKGTDVHVFHYGKVGILHDVYEVGDVCIPHSAIDEEVREGLSHPLRFQNQLYENVLLLQDLRNQVQGYVRTGTTVNTISVLRQTKKGLEDARKAGGDFIDMEWLPMAALLVGYKNSYPDLGGLYFYFAGIGSDKPRHGKTLGNTRYAHAVERKVADALKEVAGRV